MENVEKARTLPVERGSRAAFIHRVALSLRPGGARREASANRRLFSAMLTVGALNAVVMAVSTIRELVVAHQFGLSDGLDAFLVAYLLPSSAISIVAGSFNAALIPTYIQVREQEGRQAAQHLFASVTVVSCSLLLCFSILLGVLSPYLLPLLGSSFTAEKLALTRTLFFLILPALPLSGLFVTWAAVLNAGERFALAAITPVLTPLVVMLSLCVFANTWGIYAYAAAILSGVIIEGAVLAAGLRRQGIGILPRWHGRTSATAQVMRQYAPMIAGAFLMSGTGLVDQAMAGMLGTGSISILSFGKKVSSVVVGIGSLALSTAVLPHFSRLVANRQWQEVKRTLRVYTPLVLVTTIPLTLVLILFSRPLTRLLFQRGAFTAGDTIHVASVQSLYFLQIPFYIAGMLFVRLISSLKANHILLWGTGVSFVLNVTLDYLFLKCFGLSGIALSTSAVYMAAFAFLSVMGLRLLNKREGEPQS